MIISSLVYFLVIASLVALSSVTVGLGESLIAKATLQCINFQPSAKNEINKVSILGLAINETAAIIGLLVAIILISNLNFQPEMALPILGIGCAICLPSVMSGIYTARPIIKACEAVARQPFFNSKITNIMLITTSFIQTPVIFGLIITLFINHLIPSCHSQTAAIQLFASGLCLGLGSIGSIIGLSKYAEQACFSVGYNRQVFFKVMTFTFVSQALIETPVIFALIISLMILNHAVPQESLLLSAGFISAALVCAISNLAPAIRSGQIAAAACKEIAANPQASSLVSKASLIAQGMLDSFAIYGWTIALFILFKI